MGIRVGMPILKLGHGKGGTKRRGNLGAVIKEAWLSEAQDGGLCRYSKHYDRARLDMNEFTGYQMADDLIAAIEDRAAEYSEDYTARTGRKMRADAVLAYGLVVKPPAEWMQGLTEAERAKFWQDSNAAIGHILGDTIMATTTQRDEQGEHQHIVGMPFTADGRLSGRDFLNLKLFKRFNQEYPVAMRACGWDIDDAVVYDAEAVKGMPPDEQAAYKQAHATKKQGVKHGLSTDDYMRQQEEKRKAEIARMDADIADKAARLEKMGEQEQKAEEMSRGPIIGRAAKKAEARRKDEEQKAEEAKARREAEEKKAAEATRMVQERQAALRAMDNTEKRLKAKLDALRPEGDITDREMVVALKSVCDGMQDGERLWKIVVKRAERERAFWEMDIDAVMGDAVKRTQQYQRDVGPGTSKPKTKDDLSL